MLELGWFKKLFSITHLNGVVAKLSSKFATPISTPTSLFSSTFLLPGVVLGDGDRLGQVLLDPGVGDDDVLLWLVPGVSLGVLDLSDDIHALLKKQQRFGTWAVEGFVNRSQMFRRVKTIATNEYTEIGTVT